MCFILQLYNIVYTILNDIDSYYYKRVNLNIT